MSHFQRQVYATLIRLHPTDFRNQFGREMQLDFADALHTYGPGQLWRDAIWSLGRQWSTHLLTSTPQPTTAHRPSLLTGDYVIIRDKPFTPLELARGIAASAAFLVLCMSGLGSPQDAVIDPRIVYASSSPSTVSSHVNSSSSGGSHGPNIGPFRNIAAAFSKIPKTAQVGLAHAQILHATDPLPTFEVVTVKPWKRPPPPTPPPPPPEGSAAPTPVLPAKIAPGQSFGQKTDRVHSILPAQLLIAFAYNLPFGSESRVTGGPDWVKTDQYEIQGKIEDAQFVAIQAMTPRQQTEQVNLMQQALLRDRFNLEVHFETKEKTAFALVIAKGGPKLTQASEGEPTKLSMLGNEITAKAVTIDQLSHAPFLGARTVVNQTEPDGRLRFHVDLVGSGRCHREWHRSTVLLYSTSRATRPQTRADEDAGRSHRHRPHRTPRRELITAEYRSSHSAFVPPLYWADDP